MLAFVPLLVIVAVIVVPLAAHIRQGFTHADDGWTATDYADRKSVV